MRRTFPRYKRAEMDECGFRDYHKETMRERCERSGRGWGAESLVWARLFLAGSSFSAPEPIQVDERRFSFSPLARSPARPPARPRFSSAISRRALSRVKRGRSRRRCAMWRNYRCASRCTLKTRDVTLWWW